MPHKRRLHKLIDEQVKKWEFARSQKEERKIIKPVVSISREPGSGGRLIAEALSEKIGFTVFHQEVVHEMAKNAEVGIRIIETLDERGLNVIDNWIGSIIQDRHLWPDEYMKHLMKLIGTIGKHGNSIIVGRGANFILLPQKSLKVRIIAPFKERVANISKSFDISEEDADFRIIRTESNRRAFVRKHFNAKISEPLHYDLIINTGVLSIPDAVTAISGILKNKFPA